MTSKFLCEIVLVCVFFPHRLISVYFHSNVFVCTDVLHHCLHKWLDLITQWLRVPRRKTVSWFFFFLFYRTKPQCPTYVYEKQGGKCRAEQTIPEWTWHDVIPASLQNTLTFIRSASVWMLVKSPRWRECWPQVQWAVHSCSLNQTMAEQESGPLFDICM